MNTNPCPIYVISLKRTPERRLHIQRQLDALNLSYRFVDAIDRYDVLLSPTYRAEIIRSLGMYRGDTIENNLPVYFYCDLACILSHIKAYNLMIENNDQIACILEDDALISPDFPEILSASQKIPWDILMLSSRSYTLQNIQTTNYNVQKGVEIFPKIDRSIFPRLRKVKWFRRLLLYNVISQDQLDWIPMHRLKLYLLMLLSHSKTLNKILYKCFFKPCKPILEFLNPNRLTLCEYKGTDYYLHRACQLGALPIRSSQRTLYGNYDIATPTERPLSAMGYMLTLSMAYRWKKSVNVTQHLPVDCMPWFLQGLHGIKLRIVTPPCIVAPLTYLRHHQ